MKKFVFNIVLKTFFLVLKMFFLSFQVNGEVAVKLFATSSSFTSNASYNSCIGWIVSKLMNVSSHALIGQSTLPSSNATLCSNVTLNNISITNVAFDCTTGYQKALYNSYFLCLRGKIYNRISVCLNDFIV